MPTAKKKSKRATPTARRAAPKPAKRTRAKASPSPKPTKPTKPAKRSTKPRSARGSGPQRERSAARTKAVVALTPRQTRTRFADEDPDTLAFVAGHRTNDPLAEALAEESLRAATSGQDEPRDPATDERLAELGGPFVETSEAEEMAFDAEASEPAASIEGEREEPDDEPTRSHEAGTEALEDGLAAAEPEDDAVVRFAGADDEGAGELFF